jgi:hypothetical protein
MCREVSNSGVSRYEALRDEREVDRRREREKEEQREESNRRREERRDDQDRRLDAERREKEERREDDRERREDDKERKAEQRERRNRLEDLEFKARCGSHFLVYVHCLLRIMGGFQPANVNVNVPANVVSRLEITFMGIGRK